jgi:hypothetical protein
VPLSPAALFFGKSQNPDGSAGRAGKNGRWTRKMNPDFSQSGKFFHGKGRNHTKGLKAKNQKKKDDV